MEIPNSWFTATDHLKKNPPPHKVAESLTSVKLERVFLKVGLREVEATREIVDLVSMERSGVLRDMREAMVGDVKGLHGCTTGSGEGMKSLNGDKMGSFVGFINLHP